MDLSTAEGSFADGGLDSANDELLEFRSSGERGIVGCKVTRVVTERRKPGPSAIVVLTPGNRMKRTVPGVVTYC